MKLKTQDRLSGEFDGYSIGQGPELFSQRELITDSPIGDRSYDLAQLFEHSRDSAGAGDAAVAGGTSGSDDGLFAAIERAQQNTI